MKKELYLEEGYELTDFEIGFLLGYEICKIDESIKKENNDTDKQNYD